MYTRLFLLIAVALLLCSRVNGQAYTVKQERFTTADGLSHNAVYSLMEDSRGLLWLSTRYGVNRFDGRHFRNYTREEDGLHHNFIDQVYEDPDGVIWMLTGVEGFVLADFQRTFGYTLFDAYAERTIDAATYLSPALLADLAGCDVFTQLPDRSIMFYSNAGYAVHYRGKGDYERLDFSDWPAGSNVIRPLALDNTTLLGLTEEGKPIPTNDTTGTISHRFDWLNAETFGPFRYDEFLPLNRRPGQWLWRLRDGQGRPGYQLRWAGDRFTVDTLAVMFPVLAGYPEARLKHADYEDQRYFVDTDEGTLVLEAPGSIVGSLPGVHLGRYAFTDRQGHLYSIDRRNGLTRYTLNPNIFTVTGFPGGNHRGLAEDDFGRLWLSIEKGSYETFTPEVTDRLLLTDNQTVMRDHRGNIWVGLPTNGYKDDTESRPFLLRYRGGRLNEVDTFSLPEPIVTDLWTIWEDPTDGTVWTANRYGTVTRTVPTTGESQRMPFIRDTRWNKNMLVYDFTRQSDGTLWVGTSVGLYHLDAADNLLALYSSAQSGEHHLPAGSVHDVYTDGPDVLWLATGDAGLLRWTPKVPTALRQYTPADGFPSMVTHASYEDSLGFLWIPTEDGIVQFHKETELVRVYRPAEGTSDTEYNRISHHRNKDGTLYFGGISGVTKFHPRDVHRIQRARRTDQFLTVIDVQRVNLTTGQTDNIAGEILNNGTPIILSPERPRATIQLLQNHAAGSALVYFSQLEEIPGTLTRLDEGKVALNDLPYGDHTLLLQARAIDGELLEERRIAVEVIRPFYFRWWFILLFAIALATLVWGVAYLENRRLRGLVLERTARIEAARRTIEQQAEELRQLDRFKSRFFVNVSHELRTPLTLVLAPIRRLLRQPGLPAWSFDSLRRADNNGHRLLRMVNDILDLSKLEEGRLEVTPEATPLHAFFARLAANFDSLAEQREINLSAHVDLPRDLIGDLDRGKVESIVQNLLANAIRFTPAGGRVELRVRQTPGKLRLVVTDNGQGIAPEDQDKLFDRFYQSRHGEGSRPGGGTGVGLAICRELTQLMGGRIGLESELGAGSRFTVELPLTVHPAGAEGEAFLGTLPLAPRRLSRSAPLPTAETAPDAPTLLVVEDNPDLREYLSEILTGEFNLLTANNGRVALDLLRQRKAAGQLPDLIITDLMMPEMNGFTLLRQLKDDRELALLPTIVLSARSAAGDKLNVLRIGVDDYLLKPFDEMELLQRIRNLLTNARNRQKALRRAPDEPESAPVAGVQPPVADPTINEADARWLAEAEDHVRANLADPGFGNAALAALLFVSTRTLSRRIKVLTGLSANKFMLEIRLLEARRLLETSPPPSLGTVAEAIGFAKTSYFTSRFRERFGISPGEYRR